MDYCDVFISCLDSHSDGTHSLQRIHWLVSDVMLHFSKSVPVKKQTHPHLVWPEGEYIFSICPLFCTNYSCNALLCCCRYLPRCSGWLLTGSSPTLCDSWLEYLVQSKFMGFYFLVISTRGVTTIDIEGDKSPPQ